MGNPDPVRLGVIGCGGMARGHMKYFNSIDGLKFVAAADVSRSSVEAVAEEHEVHAYESGEKLIASGAVDAVMIATPHYSHPALSIAAMDAGLHVLVEKPVAVTAADAQSVNDHHAQHPELIYAAMFNQRTHPVWRMVKRLLDEGRVGRIQRVSWTITNWYRTEAYYQSGGWRATWRGEGGGVLLNQCPHNLDLFQWFVGLPTRVNAIVGLGQFHEIEVEDNVTAMMSFENGGTGTFITSTGEAPGENRLVIVGDKATLIASLGGGNAVLGGAEGGGTVQLRENVTPVNEHLRTSPERFGKPACNDYVIQPGDKAEDHKAITRNFINAIRLGEPLIAPGEEGIKGLELGNAMLLAGLDQTWIDLPMDREAYRDRLRALGEGVGSATAAPREG